MCHLGKQTSQTELETSVEKSVLVLPSAQVKRFSVSCRWYFLLSKYSWYNYLCLSNKDCPTKYLSNEDQFRRLNFKETLGKSAKKNIESVAMLIPPLDPLSPATLSVLGYFFALFLDY